MPNLEEAGADGLWALKTEFCDHQEPSQDY